jgi:glucosyl-3-phosphoglycerate synthase
MMSDFHQQGVIADLHRLHETLDSESYLFTLEGELEESARKARMALILPVHISEFRAGKALPRIVAEISKVRYLRQILIALGGVEQLNDFQAAKDYFRRLGATGADVNVIWVDGPRIQSVFRSLQDQKISIGASGKGQSVWIALGYLFAQNHCELVALHDCDILTYDRIFLARLFHPLANPSGHFQFCKGYYPRYSSRERVMQGRVTRLFVIPFLDAMKTVVEHGDGKHPLRHYFAFFSAFKYPLAGEVSFAAALGKSLEFSSDWGLEVAMISQVYHHLKPRQVAQVALTSNYDHKHQDLSPDDSAKGLHKMVLNIAAFFSHFFVSQGLVVDEAFRTLLCREYAKSAARFMDFYDADAAINSFSYDRFQEETTVRCFQWFLQNGWGKDAGASQAALLPSWKKVASTIPHIQNELVKAVTEDNVLPGCLLKRQDPLPTANQQTTIFHNGKI